jgi:Fe-S cluster biogenesis protein NfuA
VADTVESIVDEVLRPLVSVDGGEVEIVSNTSDEIVLVLRGACAGCPGRVYTTSNVIEPLLRTVIGDRTRIVVE